MKAILEFDLNEEEYEYRRMITGNAAHTTLEELDEYLRREIKYSDTHSEDVFEAFEAIREKLWQLRQDNGVISD